MSPCEGNNRIEVPWPPDVTAFRCPRCGAEMVNETNGGQIVAKPPTCGVFHAPVEMEQIALGRDAFRPDSEEGKT